MSSATVESLELRISNKAEGVASGIRDISSALKELKLASRNGAGLGDVVNQLNALNAALRRTRALTNRKINIPVNTSGVSKAVGAVTQKMSSQVGTNSASSQAVSGQTFHGGGEESGAMSEVAKSATTASSKVKETTKALTDYQKNMEGLRQKSLELTVQSKELTVATKEANLQLANMRLDERISKQAETATGKLGKFVGMLKRILMYRVLRSIISEIGAAMKEGIQNAYEWSKLNDGQFAQSMDTLASCAAQLKNALGAIAVPIIQVVTPAIQFVTRVIVDLANAISWLWSVITGAGSYFKVSTDYMTEFGKSAKSAGGAAGSAAKEMRTILGFDEINKLNGDNGGGGSGGGGSGSGVDFGSMFSKEAVNFNLMDKLKKALSSVGDSFRIAGGKVKEFVAELVGATEPIQAAQTTSERLTAAQGDLLKQSENNINVWAGSTSSTIMYWANKVKTDTSLGMASMADSVKVNLGQAQNTTRTWANDTITLYDSVTSNAKKNLESLNNSFSKSQANVSSFSSNTKKDLSNWSVATSESVRSGSSASATNIYNALKNSSDNISVWEQATSSNIGSWATSTSGTMASWAQSFVQNVADACQKAFDNIKSYNNATGAKANLGSYVAKKTVGTTIAVAALAAAGGGKNIGLNKNVSANAMAYARGGFPIVGDLFIANERGPELVGSMNNRPAVANQQQIIEGISQGVARAMMTQEALLREQNELLRSRGDVVVTTGSIVDSFSRMNRRSGTTVVPVGG